MTPPERSHGQVDGWILGVPGLIRADEGEWRRVEALRHARKSVLLHRACGRGRNGRVTRKGGRTLVISDLACMYGLTVR